MTRHMTWFRYGKVSMTGPRWGVPGSQADYQHRLWYWLGRP